MKLLPTTTVCLILLVGVCACEKDVIPSLGPAPDPNSKSKIYLNGQLTNYWPDITRAAGTDYLLFTFDQVRGQYRNQIYLNDFVDMFPPYLHTNSMKFLQTRGYDQGNHKYEPYETEQARFQIDYLDTLTRTVRGSFEAKFRRTVSGQENSDSYLPTTLHFVGTFDTTYLQF